jgi:hypothetical protein
MDRPAWSAALRADPLPWLIDPAAPAVRHRALVDLVGLPGDDPDVVEARATAMAAPPIEPILAAQDPEGWWVQPGPGYGPKYRSTVWSLIFLEQLGADGTDERIRRGCAYLLDHATVPGESFAVGYGEGRLQPAVQIHCLTGNLLRALIGLGWGEEPRVRDAIAWETAAILGTEGHRYTKSGTPGPGFACSVNEALPCGWGAAKAVLGLARIPVEARTPDVERALAAGVEMLLSVDPSTAAYPMGWGNEKPNGSWFKLGFPLGYVADVLQVMEAVCEAGAAGDARLAPAVDWLLAQQGADGRFVNRYAYVSKMAANIDRQGALSRWVTLRACRVLKAVHAATAPA